MTENWGKLVDLEEESLLPLPAQYIAAGNMLEQAAKLIIEALEENPNREGLKDTPRRFKEMFLADFSKNGTPEKALEEMVMKEEKFDQMIMVRDVRVQSHCEHHLLPWIGRMCIGYVPNDKVVGLSKITRMVEAASRGLSIQERVGEQLADAMEKVLEPRGVMIVIEAKHLCTLIRGVRAENQDMVTSITRGAFKEENNPARSEFMTLWSRGGLGL